MTVPPEIIRDRATLLRKFHDLKAGDIICSKIPLRYSEEHLLLDLVSRGVRFIPSATALLASKSKAFQTAIFKPWMLPDTTVIHDLNQLLEIISVYQRRKTGRVVLKQDRKNAGLGILLYRSIEDIYNQAANNILSYPFVIQPFVEESRDMRVVILGDYIEAYNRFSPDNFRNNLHCGGTAESCPIPDAALQICSEVMRRGDFPYGHLDLMLTRENEIFLAEISLRGGLRGAQITHQEYEEKIAAIEQKILDTLLQ